jgi:hypothetical protein
LQLATAFVSTDDKKLKKKGKQ